jgi:hypothetical protein
MHENRETSEAPEANLATGRRGKAISRTACMCVFEESDGGTAPMNHSNKSGKPPAESEKERPLIKENTHHNPARSRRRARSACPKGWRVCAGSKGTYVRRMEGEEL